MKHDSITLKQRHVTAAPYKLTCSYSRPDNSRCVAMTTACAVKYCFWSRVVGLFVTKFATLQLCSFVIRLLAALQEDGYSSSVIELSALDGHWLRDHHATGSAITMPTGSAIMPFNSQDGVCCA